jgi:hypothetical protein
MDALMATSSAPDIIQEAKDRFKRCQDWEAEARKRFVADRKFANGDSDNMWQWDDRIAGDRIRDNRPMLTINKTQQHNLQIINDARKNKPEIRIRPVGDGATYKSAQVFQSVCRHIEYISNAQTVYDRATTFQVEGGIGYWRVVTDYADSESLDQEIFLRAIKDPLSVYLDPDINEADGSDARFGIIFDDVPTDKFKAKFPQYKDSIPTQTLNNGDDWLNEDHVRVAEYYRRLEKKDQLVSWIGEDGQRQQSKASKLGKEVVAALAADDSTDFRSRDITEDVIEWRLIVGDKVVEKNIWPGRYIPIVRVIGVETVIDGKLDRKGHTRAMKDPQRQYNYWTSSAAEQVALQGKNPYVAPVRAIEGHEVYWKNANTENYSVLPFNDVDDTGTPIAAPQRSAPPVMATAYVQGMQITRQELMEVSGQYEAEMGAPGNERSGVAIEARQRQGDTATYHFIDGLAVAIRFTGKILIDLIPRIYDTVRILRLLASDGSVDMDSQPVQIDPQAKDAYQEHANDNGEIVARIFNPNVGRYDVQADIGPDFATRRQETFNALMQLVQEDSALLPLVGDILFRAADFAMADEVAERLKNMVPEQALGGPSQQTQEMQQQLQQLQNALQQSIEALADAKKTQENDKYKAETDRMKMGVQVDPLVLVPAIRQAVMDAIGQQLPSGIPVVGQATIPDEPAEKQAA